MAFFHFSNVKVAALAGAVPEHVQEIDLSPEHPEASYISAFVKQTGVTQRHISITEQTSVDTGYVATQKALELAGWDASSLDGLVFLTQTPDFNNATGNSFLLQHHLGVREDAVVFDVAQGCAAFPFGMAICGGFLQQAGIKRLAVICGDTMWPMYSSVKALQGAATFLVGEGTAAILLERAEDSPVDIALYSDGNGYHFLYDPWAGVRHAWRHVPGIMPNGEVFSGGSYMDGMEITAFATMRVVDTIKDFLEKHSRTIADYDALILHQANKQIVKTIGRRLKAANVPMTVDHLANTNGASALLTLIDAYAGCEKDRLDLLISAFGIGLSWGIVSLSINPEIIAPLVSTSHRFDEDFLKPLPA